MKTLLTIGFTVLALAICGTALLFGLHVNADPLNTGHLHFAVIACMPLLGVAIGRAFPREA